MKFLDFFAGIGGIRLGLEQAGHECIGFCEFDKYARQSYKAMFNTEGEWESHDIRTINAADVPKADIWTGGFPCQDISVAGCQRGITGGERSGLFFEIIRLLAEIPEENKPGWLILENVKNVLHINKGFDFCRILLELGNVGFDVEWQLVNSKDYNVPQNRERVFFIGHNRTKRSRKILPIMPTNGKNPCKLQEITNGIKQANRIYNGNGIAKTIIGTSGGAERKQAFIDLDAKGQITETARTITTHYIKHQVSNFQAESSGVIEKSFIDLNPGGGCTETARTLQARYAKGWSNHKGETSGIIECGVHRSGYKIQPNNGNSADNIGQDFQGMRNMGRRNR